MVWNRTVAPTFSRNRRRRRFGVLLACLLLPAGCRPQLPADASAGGAAVGPALTSGGRPADMPDEVRLGALPGGAPAPGGDARNPFRFARAPAPPPLMPADGVPGGNPAISPGRVDGWRPAGDPEAIRFLGVLEAPESVGRVAVVTDGDGVYHGRAGDVVGGRYRIVAIDRTAVVIERVEGGERLTLSAG